MPRDISRFYLLGDKVTDKTKHAYKQAIRRFQDWCDDNAVRPSTRSDFDWILLEYIHCKYEENNGGGMAHVSTLLSALQLFSPRLKGKLRLSAQALAGWRRRHPGKRHPPLTWHLTVAIAAQLAVWSQFDMAVGVLVSFAAMLRIGEMCGIKVSDVLDSDADDPRVGETKLSGIRLRKTKTGSNLFAELHNVHVQQLLRSFMRGKRANDRVFAFSAGTFRKWFKRAVVSLGLNTMYTPHSLRHGAATALYMMGVPLETILVRGRWASTKSARHYVQQGQALLLAQSVPLPIRDLGRSVAQRLFGVFTWMMEQSSAVSSPTASGSRLRFSDSPPPKPPAAVTAPLTVPLIADARSFHSQNAATHIAVVQSADVTAVLRAAEAHTSQVRSETVPSPFTRHSARHDFLVRPNYAALDQHTLAGRR